MNLAPRMKYGTEEVTKILDENGSTETTVTKTHAGVSKISSRRLAIRHRTDKTDIKKISEIAAALMNDPLKMDAEIRLERTKHGEMNGYYHLVECYTLVEY